MPVHYCGTLYRKIIDVCDVEKLVVYKDLLSIPTLFPPPLPPPLCRSIEEDFVTWKENLWSTVCEKFGVESTQEAGIIREYQLTVHQDLPSEKVFVGEPHRLGTYIDQKP